jgi:hypothetical protein
VDLVKQFLDSFRANAGLTPRAFAVITGDKVIESALQLVNAPTDQEALRLGHLGKKLWLGTLLHEAAALGNEAIVTFLLNKKADISELVTDRGSPLFAAVEGHHVAVVRRLLQAGITPTARELGNIWMFCARNSLDDIRDIFIRHLLGEDWETQPFRQVEIQHSGSQRSDSPTSLYSNSLRSSLQRAVTDRSVYSEKHDSIPLSAPSFRRASTESYTSSRASPILRASTPIGDLADLQGQKSLQELKNLPPQAVTNTSTTPPELESTRSNAEELQNPIPQTLKTEDSGAGRRRRPRLLGPLSDTIFVAQNHSYLKTEKELRFSELSSGFEPTLRPLSRERTNGVLVHINNCLDFPSDRFPAHWTSSSEVSIPPLRIRELS